VITFAGKAGAYQSESPNGWLPTIPAKMRLGRKWLTVANTPAYYDTATITTVKCFTVKAPGANPIKPFTAVIYEFS
jgi:hypothetical protein